MRFGARGPHILTCEVTLPSTPGHARVLPPGAFSPSKRGPAGKSTLQIGRPHSTHFEGFFFFPPRGIPRVSGPRIDLPFSEFAEAASPTPLALSRTAAQRASGAGPGYTGWALRVSRSSPIGCSHHRQSQRLPRPCGGGPSHSDENSGCPAPPAMPEPIGEACQ